MFSCSTQLSTEFQLLKTTKIPTNEEVLALSISDVVFIMLINVQMPTIVDKPLGLIWAPNCLQKLSADDTSRQRLS